MNLNTLCFFLLLTSVYSCSDQVKTVDTNGGLHNDIIVSPIGDVSITSGEGITVYLSAIDDKLENVIYEVNSDISHTITRNAKDGMCEIHIDGNNSFTENQKVDVKVTNGDDRTDLSFVVNMENLANIYYCDPQVTSNGDGSKMDPFMSLDKLLASGYQPKQGSNIMLRSGNHGVLKLDGKGYIISAASLSQPTVKSIKFNAVKDITIRGLTISDQSTSREDELILIDIDSLSSNIIIENCLIQSIENSNNWSQDRWYKSAATYGIFCRADNTIIRNNLIRNIHHGIEITSDHTIVSYNTIDRFGEDAIRNTGSHNVYSYNMLKNATIDDYYDPGGNHDDLFQAWTFDKPVENIVLEGNIAVSCADKKLKLKSKIVQGLVCFDGFEKNWVVKNNLVVTDHPHGIALYGAENCTIINNTVLKNPERRFYFESEPWIMVNDHKDGRVSKGNTVTDNITSALNLVSHGTIEANNTIADSIHTDLLKDYIGWNFNLARK